MKKGYWIILFPSIKKGRTTHYIAPDDLINKL